MVRGFLTFGPETGAEFSAALGIGRSRQATCGQQRAGLFIVTRSPPMSHGVLIAWPTHGPSDSAWTRPPRRRQPPAMDETFTELRRSYHGIANAQIVAKCGKLLTKWGPYEIVIQTAVWFMETSEYRLMTVITSRLRLGVP